MAAQDHVAVLRRWIAETDTRTYTDDMIAEVIQRYVVDPRDLPERVDRFGEPLELVYELYDLHAAAAELWEEKAAALIGKGSFTFST